ncbi:hypothetical protein HNV12_22575 [Methanococcoides sp. SA1]|nr:hypothetical protein [Methanococcoides sp. SA1]
MNFEEEVIAYLQENTYERPEKLVDSFNKRHTTLKEDSKPDVELGYSKPTIKRHLKKMVELKLIVKLEGNDISKYGFPDVDGRAKYLVLPETLKYKLHFDEVLNFLESGDDEDVKIALKEMELYEQEYTFDSKQLDSLVRKLTSNDISLVNTLLRIIYGYITKKGIKPYDEDNFLNVLRSLLKAYPEKNRDYPNLRTRVIFLLGFYDDEVVIDQLKKDAEHLDDPDSVKEDYFSEYTSKVIESHRTDLFNFERKMRKKGNQAAAQLITEVRYQAMDNLGLIEKQLKSSDSEDW